MTNELTFEQNKKYIEDTARLKENIEGEFLVLGQRLMVIRDEHRYSPDFDNMADFCDEMMHFSEATASKLINIYSRFVLEFGIDPKKIVEAGGWSRAAKILPIAASKEQVEELLHKSSLMTQSDFFNEIAEKKTGRSQATCPHNNAYSIMVCRDCGYKWQIMQDDE